MKLQTNIEITSQFWGEYKFKYPYRCSYAVKLTILDHKATLVRLTLFFFRKINIKAKNIAFRITSAI